MDSVYLGGGRPEVGVDVEQRLATELAVVRELAVRPLLDLLPLELQGRQAGDDDIHGEEDVGLEGENDKGDRWYVCMQHEFTLSIVYA
jgi:hypothetical protein